MRHLNHEYIIMKFDPKKPHGAIWGHPTAAYEQDGVLFAGDGSVVVSGVPAIADEIPETADSSGTPESDFVRSMLSGGQVAQSNIYKECGFRGLDWAKVKTAAADQGVKMSDGRAKGGSIWSVT